MMFSMSVEDIPIRYDCRCVFCSDRTNGHKSHHFTATLSPQTEKVKRALLQALNTYNHRCQILYPVKEQNFLLYISLNSFAKHALSFPLV